MAKKPTVDNLAAFSTRPNAHPKPEAPEAKPKTERIPFSSYVDRELADRVRQLAFEASVYRRSRVSVADLVEEALRDLVAKYEG
jgi:hypothetical protein